MTHNIDGLAAEMRELIQSSQRIHNEQGEELRVLRERINDLEDELAENILGRHCDR